MAGGDAIADDRHETVDDQAGFHETTFGALTTLVDELTARPGRDAGTKMIDDTVVVCFSEFSRTPKLNANNGKDHWPYTSAMVVGPNLVGDRVIGGFDRQFYGKSIDSVTGDLFEGGEILSAESLGATLLAMADVDPLAYVDGVDPIMGMLA